MTDISALEAYAGQLSEAAALATASAQTQRQIVNGDAVTDVLTESGLVPSLAKQAVLAQAKVTAALEEVASGLSGAMAFTTTAKGLVATDPGELFGVLSPNDREYVLIYENVAGVAVPTGKSYPSTLAVEAARLTSLGLGSTFGGEALGGATAILDNGKYVGFAIAVGATGASSYVDCNFNLGAALLAKLVGNEVELITQFEASAGFLGIYPMTPRVRVGRGASYVDLVPTSNTLEQNGTVLTLRMRYTVTAADLYLKAFYQVANNHAVAAVASSLKAKAASYSVTKLASGVNTPSDFMMEQRLSPLSDAIAVAQASAASATLSTGNLFSSVALSGEALGGASFIAAADGRTAGGLKIPTGATGAIAYQTAMTSVTALVGCKLKFTLVYKATANFLTETPLSTALLRVSRAAGYVNLVPAEYTRTQVGTVLTVTMSYTVLAGDLAAGTLLQVAGNSTAVAQDRTVELEQFSYVVGAVPAGSKSASDLVLPQILATQKAVILEEAKASIAVARLTSGELAPACVTTGQLFNGGQYLTVDGVTVGLSIPAGVTGGGSYIASALPLSAGMLKKMVGAMIRLTVSYDTTDNFLAETPRSGVQLQVVRAGVTVNVVPASIITTQLGTVLTTVLTYVVTAADTSIKPVYQVLSPGAVQAHNRTMTLKSVTYSVEALAAGTTFTPEDLLLAVQLQAVKDAIPEEFVVIPVKVGPTGLYATPKLAMAAITDATATKHYELLIDTSVVYDQDCNWFVKDYVHMTADGPGFAHIHYENPDNVDPAVIQNFQTFWMNTTSILTRLKVTGRNVRYPIHSDSGGVLKGRTQQLKQCWIEHLGNSGAQDYQNSISSGVTVWTSLHAWGCGTSSAMVIEADGTVFRSPNSAFYFHTRELFGKGCRVTLRGARMLTTNDTGAAVTVQPLGSLQGDVLELIGCEIGGFMSYQASPWIPDTLENQPANHSEVRVFGHGNSAFALKITEFGRALKIESNDVTDASKIEVSGDAVEFIFGRRVYALPGAGGIKGYVYGWADISGVGVGLLSNVFITSLGKRLGDCSVTNKTLSVKVNGGATTVVTFNQDYTAQSNAAILTAINAALGSVAVASAYNVGARYRPEITDEERSLKNNSLEGILMGMVLAYDGDNKKVRKMTAADPSSLFAGVAVEDIYPGQWGRVKTCGWVLNTDLYGFTGAPSFHQPFYVDAAVPGKPTLTPGANPIMRGKASNIVEVSPK